MLIPLSIISGTTFAASRDIDTSCRQSVGMVFGVRSTARSTITDSLHRRGEPERLPNSSYVGDVGGAKTEPIEGI
jgi:hypothetical protein